ncbi:MAG: hypothetical protein V3T86_06435 [Planctomycetota bacterium]
MRKLSALALVAVIAGVADARPPKIGNYARIDVLLAKFNEASVRQAEMERFLKKPRMERMILSFLWHWKEFENKTLTGEVVVKEVFKSWTAFHAPKPEPDVVRIAALLPAALMENYSAMKAASVDKDERHKASLTLVDALNDKQFHVRMLAISCLKQIYGTSNQYSATASSRDRRKSQASWKKLIKRRKNR